MPERPGALVISLDFELHWGVRDHVGRHDPLYRRLPRPGAPYADIIALFTAAHPGHLGHGWVPLRIDPHELDAHLPNERPTYERPDLDPYVETIGLDEKQDPEHLAGSLVELIATTAGQEVGSHTFSHYYCLDPGQEESTFRADLAAAQSIARWRGLELTSLVLPRNQWNPAYTDVVLDLGFRCIRGPQRTWGYEARRSGDDHGPLRRAARLADAYIGPSPPPTTAWSDVLDPSGLCNIPASAFMRPFAPSRKGLEPLRLARLRSGLRQAARRGRIFHLWWHPHNFSQHRTENISVLEGVLDEFDALASTEGMRSFSMGDVMTMVSARS